MTLFADFDRIDSSPAGHREGHFPFLNRVSTPYWVEVRRVMNEWFERVPEDEQLDLQARFTQRDNRQHLSAFWELYLREVFSRLGYAVTPHPKLANSSNTPDFLVEREGDRFYIEAVTLFDEEDTETSGRRRGQVYEHIDRHVRSANFFLEVETIQEGTATPPLTKISNELNRWLDNLDPDVASKGAISSGYWNLPTHEARHGDWFFRFRALPKRPDRRTAEGRTIGLFGPPEARFVADYADIKDRIARKSRKYGPLDRPLIVAMLSARWTTDNEQLLRSLFGSTLGHSQIVREATIPKEWPKDTEGLWLTRDGPRHRNCSAVLYAFGLAPMFIARFAPELVRNPWARQPLFASLPFRETQVSLETGESVELNGSFSPSQFFGLPAIWPPGEPFPKDANSDS